MAEAGDFELLRAFITTQLDKTSYQQAKASLNHLSTLQNKLTATPWKIYVETTGDLESTRQRIEGISAALKTIPKGGKPINIGIKNADAQAKVNVADLQAAFRKAFAGLDKDAAMAAERILAAFTGAANSGTMAISDSVLRKLEEWASRYRATLSGPVIKKDSEQQNFLRQVKQANKVHGDGIKDRTEAQKRAARDFDKWISGLEKKAEARKIARDKRLAQVPAKLVGAAERKALIRKLQGRTAQASLTGSTQSDLNKLLADIDKASARATQKQREQLNALKADVKLLLKELQAEQKKVAAQNLRMRQVPAKKIAYSERKALQERLKDQKEGEKAVANAKRLRKEDLADQRRHYNNQQEVVSKGLFEIRRNLHGFGPASAVLSRNLTRDQLRFADANGKLRQALAKGDFGEIKKAGAEMDALAAKTRRLAMALSQTQMYIGIFKSALRGLGSIAGFVGTVMGKLLAPIIAIGRFAVRTSLGILQTGLRALLAPTLAVISAFQRMASYLPLIFGYGMIRWVKDAISTFSEFQAQIARGAGQLGIFGAAGEGAMNRLSKGARQVARTWMISQTEIAQGIEELARGGITAGIKDTEKMVSVILAELENAAAIRLATGLDIGEAAKELIILRSQFGSIGREADDAADSIIAMQAAAPVTAVDIRRFFEAVGAAGRNANIAFEDLGASGVKMMQSVASGSRAGTALSRALMILIDPTKDASKAIRDLGLDMRVFLDESQQAFSSDGILRFSEAVDQAKAGLRDMSRIFGFRARDVANLFNFDTNRLRTASNDVRDFSAEIIQSQRSLASAARKAFTARNLFDLGASASQAKDAIQGIFNSITASRTQGIRLFDQANLQDTRQSVRDIASEIRTAQRTNMAKAFATLIRDKTIFGSLSSLKVELDELKIAFTETFMLTISRVLSGIRNVVMAVSEWVRTSGAVQTIQAVILKTMDRLRETVLPIVQKFARLSIIVNSTLIAAFVHLVEVIAGKLLPLLNSLAGKVEAALGLPPGVLDSWRSTADAIAWIMENIEGIVTIAMSKIKVKLADFGLLMIKALDSSSGIGSALSRSMQQFVSMGMFAVTEIAKLFGRSMIAALELVSRLFAPMLIKGVYEFTTALSGASSVLDLAIKKMFGDDWFDRALGSLTDGSADVALNDFVADMQSAAAAAAGAFNQELGTTLSAPLNEAIERSRRNLLEFRDAARLAQEEAASMFRGIEGDRIDELREVTKKLNALDLRAKESYRKVSGEVNTTVKAEIGGIEEFQKLLQQGDVQRGILDEMRNNTQVQRDTYNVIYAMRQDQLNANPNVSGGGRGQAMLGR